MNNAFISKQITKEIEVSIINAGPNYNLEDVVWAINWFDVKNKGLYDFYNVIASPHVGKVGGRALFKGRLKKKLLGEQSDEREVLLIVSYPKPDNFLDLLMGKMFQLKSIVRELAVKDFTFGFMKRLDDGERPRGRIKKYDGKLIYMVHHFKNNHQLIDTNTIKDLAAEQDIFTHFSGIKSALVGRRKGGGKLRTSPFLMDGMLIFGAFEASQFDDFIQSEYYQNFIEQNQSNYIALFNREI
jgi:uncharacterized protein (DUF1330 family)